MDIISHGLWGGIAFGRKRKNLFWWSFAFGVMPDLFSFGIFTGMVQLGMASGPDWGNGLPDPGVIPHYVHALYKVTHSLIIFALVFGLLWLFLRKPFIPLLAWCFHILLDIPTHSTAFFPTPFLWPVSDYAINGMNWSHPIILYPNLVLLTACYFIWWLSSRKSKAE